MNTPEPISSPAEINTDPQLAIGAHAGEIPPNDVRRRFPVLNPLPPLEGNIYSSHLMHAYIALALIANMGALFFKGHGGDLGYWEDWIRQLSTTGYDGFNGNYPPVYIHWLYLVGQFYNTFSIPLEHNLFLKFLTQVPVTIFHGILVGIIFHQLKRFEARRHIAHITLLLTALNPAVLINGPMWGQVDLVPSTILLASLILASGDRYVYWSIPLFALGLLTKFQMIAFAPLFGFLFFRHPGKHLIGILAAIPVALLVFLPSIIADHFWSSFRQAYIDTLGQYPMTTFNAANLWILLTDNSAPDSIVLFGVDPNSAVSKIFTAKYFGMLLFSLIALFIFLQGIHLLIRGRLQDNVREVRAHTLFAATICALAFFTLLPAMHERYSFPAVVMALGYLVFHPKQIIYPVGITLFCSVNMLIVLDISGSDVWTGLSLLTVVLLIIGLLELAAGRRFSNALRRAWLSIYKIPALSIWVLVIGVGGLTLFFAERFKIYHLTLADNERFLTDLPMDYARQDHGTMRLGKTYDNNYLSLDKKRYAQGIGTHANSDIQFRLPEGAVEFRFLAGVDDEVGTADAQFSVWGDDKLLWESPPYLGYEKDLKVQKVDVRGVTKLNLKVSALKDDKWDHVDWVNTVVVFEEAPEQDKPSNASQ